MFREIRFLTIAAIVLAIVATAWMTTASLAKGRGDAANGHGTLLVQDEQGNTVRRQFSFNAKQNSNGTVSGQAVLRNPAFLGTNGKIFQISIQISCLNIVGNRAVIGGTIKRTNDSNLTDSAFFVVEDNGEPGKDADGLSGVAFSSELGPEACQTLDTSNFAVFTIETGNIQVTGGSVQ
jgi:hypothetical protein